MPVLFTPRGFFAACRYTTFAMASRNRLYRAKDGRTISADINAAYNILRKSRPDAFAKGIAGYVVHPIRLVI